jgi:CheY-like chemotaxis protein
MTLFYVDDDEEDVDVFTEAIETISPHTVLLVATDAKEALEMLKDLTVQPDYIFMDINLPIMNGKELLKELKKLRHLKDIPVVMYSTSGNSLEVEDCKKLGAVDFIVKPPEFRKLCEALKKFV